MESYISCTFQLASFAPSNYFDSHPCCVYQCFSSFLSFSLLPPPYLLFLFFSFFLSFCFIVWVCHTLFIHLCVDGHVCCFQFLPIETKVVLVAPAFIRALSFFWGKYLEVNRQEHGVWMHLTFKENVELFSKVVVSFYIPTSTVRELHFLCILANTCFC